ncbi:transcriptional repressor [bacterium]|nr:transcriptional repressor [bacterium]
MRTSDDEVIQDKLKEAGLRPTQQRVLLARKIWGTGHRHITAECLYQEVRDSEGSVSLATVYNTLHQFTEAGLLKEIRIDGDRCMYDTNVCAHHHFMNIETGVLQDIAFGDIQVSAIPDAPEGTCVSGIEVIVRIKSKLN